MDRPGFGWSDIAVWGGLLLLTTTGIVLALRKLWQTSGQEVEPGTPPMAVRWGIPVVVLVLFWFLTAYRCFLWWRYG